MLEGAINLAIMDDHALFRKMLKNYLSGQKDMNVVIETSHTDDLLGQLRNSSVDVLLIDMIMPQVNDNDIIKIIRREYSEIKILILSMCIDLDIISGLLDSGIHGYVSKTDEPEELVKAIIAVSENKIYRTRLLTDALYRNKQNNIIADSYGNYSLSEREKKVLQLLWEEKSNKEIADHLFLSVRSIEKIRQDMKEKLGVKSTVGLIKYAIKKKILTADAQLFFDDRHYA